jgi:hypothetical protein
MGGTTVLVIHVTLKNKGMLLLTAEPVFHAHCYRLPFPSHNLKHLVASETVPVLFLLSRGALQALHTIF